MQAPIKRPDKRMAQPDKHHPMRSGRALTHQWYAGGTGRCTCGTKSRAEPHAREALLPSLSNNRKHHIPGGTRGLASQAYPIQPTHGCSTTTHCHTCQPEHYCRCRQTQYTHGARNRRTHRLAHHSAPDTDPRRHGYIHTRHKYKKRHTFQTPSTMSVTKDQPRLLQLPARTPLPAPTNSVHTWRWSQVVWFWRGRGSV
jgi:hypothetical protein